MSGPPPVETEEVLEGRLVGLARSSGPLRAALAWLASWLVRQRAWERLGYARMGDYSDERLGRSARTLQDWATVGRVLEMLPQLQGALVEGRLGWAQVRLVARREQPDDEARWIDYARRVTAQDLAHEVSKLDKGSPDEAALEDQPDTACAL